MRQGSFLSVFSVLLLMAVTIAPAWAQNSRSVVERVYQGHSANSNPVIAKQEMTNQAIDKISEDLNSKYSISGTHTKDFGIIIWVINNIVYYLKFHS